VKIVNWPVNHRTLKGKLLYNNKDTKIFHSPAGKVRFPR